MFTGQYRAEVGWGGRFLLPPAYREALAAGENVRRSLFFVGAETLCVYTDKAFGDLVFGLYDKIRGKAEMSPREALMVNLMDREKNVRYSPRGWVRIPRDYHEFYGFERGDALMLVGCGEYFEMYHRADWLHRLRNTTGMEKEG